MRILGPETNPLLSSSVKCHDWSWRAQLHLHFYLSNVVRVQKLEKLISYRKAWFISWCICAPLVVKLLTIHHICNLFAESLAGIKKMRGVIPLGANGGQKYVRIKVWRGICIWLEVGIKGKDLLHLGHSHAAFWSIHWRVSQRSFFPLEA